MDEWPRPWRDQPGAGGRDEVVTTDTISGSGYAWVSGTMFVKRPWTVASHMNGPPGDDRDSADVETAGSAFSDIERPDSSEEGYRSTDDGELWDSRDGQREGAR
jgi:hypothetical protein